MAEKKFVFQKQVMDAIYHQAREEYPSECCGWVLERSGGVQEYVASKNLQDKYHKFDPENYPRTSKEAFIPEMKKLQDQLAELGPGEKLFSIVHSHIDCGAYFSAEDKKQMSDPATGQPIYAAENYLVVAVEDKKITEHAVYYFDADQSDYRETPFLSDGES